MKGRFAIVWLFAAATLLVRAWGADPAPEIAAKAVVLRNGSVFVGEVTPEKDGVKLTRRGSTYRFADRDIDFVCDSLDQAYLKLRNRRGNSVEDHLKMCDWCLEQQLVGYAARELRGAMQADPRDPRIAQLELRLKKLREPPAQLSSNSDPVRHPASPEELERLVRTLPAGTVERFTGVVQPLLLNHCATSGCHAPGTTSSFTLLRPPPEAIVPRRLTQRNLFNTIEWIDYTDPSNSKLLKAARLPHGTANVALFGIETEQYADIYNWIAAIGRGYRSTPPDELVSGAEPSTPKTAGPESSPRRPGQFTPRIPSKLPESPHYPVEQANGEDAEKSPEPAAPEPATPEIGTPLERVGPSVYVPQRTVSPPIETSPEPLWKQFYAKPPNAPPARGSHDNQAPPSTRSPGQP